jgi:hypothetical protein
MCPYQTLQRFHIAVRKPQRFIVRLVTKTAVRPRNAPDPRLTQLTSLNLEPTQAKDPVVRVIIDPFTNKGSIAGIAKT